MLLDRLRKLLVLDREAFLGRLLRASVRRQGAQFGL